VESQEFGCGQPSVETKILRQKADFPADVYIVRGHSENECLTAAGLHESQQHLNGSAFPGAVRAKESEDFTTAHRQRKIAYGNLSSKHLAQVQRLNGEAARLIQVLLRRQSSEFASVTALLESP
jgi:hypothetical protein